MGSGPSGISGGSGFADDPHARTHHQGWPRAKIPARNYASVRRSIRSSIWGRSHRVKNRADRHALSEHVFLMRMLWTEGFTSHTTCSIPGRNRVDRDFLFDRVVITTARSDARAVFGHAVSLRVRCGCCASRLVPTHVTKAALQLATNPTKLLSALSLCHVWPCSYEQHTGPVAVDLKNDESVGSVWKKHCLSLVK